MTALYVILGIIALFCLFLFLRAKVFVTWCNELFVRVGLGPVSYEFAINDFIKKDEKTEKAEVKEKKDKKPKKEKKKKESKGKEKKKVPLKEQLEFFKNILTAVYKHFGKRVRVEKYVLKVSVGTPDAAQTAILYGGISGVMANINELILNYRHKKGARIYSECKPDFLSESMDIYVDIGASVTLWNIVITGIAAGMGWLKYKIKTKTMMNEK